MPEGDQFASSIIVIDPRSAMLPFSEGSCHKIAREDHYASLLSRKANNMATSTQINAITALYVGYFDRAPDPAGLQFWIDQIDNGREFNT
ncbi:DUF4214 domain-containing protein, partial [Nitrincola sp.]